jgi:hypothetical protein
LLKFFITGKITYAIPLFVPFFDRFSHLGYFLNGIAQLIPFATVSMSVPFADFVYFTFVSQMKIFVDIIEVDLDELENYLTTENRKRNERKVKTKFIKIIQSHWEILVYHSSLTQVINSQFLSLISLNVITICVCGISLLTSEYYMAFGIAIFFPFQIFIACALGTMVRHQHERLLDLLVKFKWYKLPIGTQKEYRIFLFNAQQEISLSPLYLGTIDMELFSLVSNLIFC